MTFLGSFHAQFLREMKIDLRLPTLTSHHTSEEWRTWSASSCSLYLFNLLLLQSSLLYQLDLPFNRHALAWPRKSRKSRKSKRMTLQLPLDPTRKLSWPEALFTALDLSHLTLLQENLLEKGMFKKKLGNAWRTWMPFWEKPGPRPLTSFVVSFLHHVPMFYALVSRC